LQISEDDLESLSSRIAGKSRELHKCLKFLQSLFPEELASKRLYADAAQVSMEYLEDIESSIRYLAEGTLFSEAKRLVRSASPDNFPFALSLPLLNPQKRLSSTHDPILSKR
jgi:hypothetical protein